MPNDPDASTRPTPRRRAALVTGASRGLGLALARFLAGQERSLVIDARGARDLERAAAELSALGASVVALLGDVTDPGHRDDLIAAAAELGGLDLLVNNASTLGASPLPSLAHAPPEALRRALEVNVVAPLALTQEALPLLAGGGLVVNVSSDAAVGGYASWGVYGASKAALDLITRTLAAELTGTGIGAVSVDPGDLRTLMHQRAFPGEDIGDRPLPDVTIPFWAWLLSQEPTAVSGRRYAAQDDRWTVAAPAVVIR
jgi:NAD(P)-dependent dehydrogenase (short-subunit alcohol dehydrogenase family)